VDSEKLLANCYFDGCAGLVFGAGCKSTGDGSCTAEIEDLIAAAVAAGLGVYYLLGPWGVFTYDTVKPKCNAGIPFD